MNDTNAILETARMLKVLGEPTRLRIFQFLRSCDGPVAVEDTGDVHKVRPEGLHKPTVGDVCCYITGEDGVNPNISFHLKELRNANLIIMERRGKNMICSVDRRAVSYLVNFFGNENTPTSCG